MFNNEIMVLQDMVKSTMEEEKGNQINRKIINLKNLSKTMNDLIKNIVSEIDNSREQMFRILESIAAIEINKDARKFNENTKSAKKRTTSSMNL
jgi:predicted  nucleic acid-binding Zn-ribbon protein